MYISENDREIEFVLVNISDREEEVIDELRDASSVFYSTQRNIPKK